jgi:hypothetical protein
MGDNGRFDCIFVHLRGLQLQDSGVGKKLLAENISRTGVCV